MSKRKPDFTTLNLNESALQKADITPCTDVIKINTLLYLRAA
jgi:hypothetical protein